MHIRSLKIFCDVVDRRSFSRAADDNGISQSSASQVVHSLEQRLGVLLLDRSTRPFVLTPEGQRYYDGCRQLVKRYGELEEEVRALHDAEARSLVVASIYSVGLHHMSAFMQRFTAEHPRAKVQLEYLHPHRVYEEVEKGDADLGLVSYPKQSETIAALPWRKEPMVVVTPPDHPLTRQMTAAGVGPSSARAALADLNGLPFVAFEEGLAIRGEIDRALARQGVHVHLELEFDNVETIKRAVEAGAGVSILPRPCIDRELALGSLAVVGIADEAVCRALGIIHRRDRQLSELARHFIGLLQADADFSDRPSGTSLEASAAPTN